MALQTRRPTGKPPWPIALIAGMPKAGKTHAAAEASASPLIDRTFWFTFGEPAADEFGAMEGARFEIVQYDGTHRGLYNAMVEASKEPMDPAKPHMWVEDSGSRLWTHLSDEAQLVANRRWAKKNGGKDLPDDGIRVPMDLWNVAKSRWNNILSLMNAHQGPVIITSRMEKVALVDNRGEPTREKDWKIQSEKNLPFEVDLVVEMHARGENYLTGVRSLRYKATEARTKLPNDFKMHDLWVKLGMADQPAGKREFVGATAEQSLAADDLIIARRHEMLEQIKEACKIARVESATVANRWMSQHHHPIQETTDLGSLAVVLADLREYIESKRAEQPEDQVA